MEMETSKSGGPSSLLINRSMVALSKLYVYGLSFVVER